MEADIVTKGEFAALSGVTPARVSQWITAKQIHGDAIVGAGHRARIRVAVAREQLRRGLDPVAHLGANGKAKLAGAAAVPSAGAGGPSMLRNIDPGEAPDTVEDEIKRARLEQLAHSNAKAEAEARARSGRYVLADDARQEMGRVAARLMATFEASLSEFANAIAADAPKSPRDALRTLRVTWREIRIRQATVHAGEAAALPALVEDYGEIRTEN